MSAQVHRVPEDPSPSRSMNSHLRDASSSSISSRSSHGNDAQSYACSLPSLTFSSHSPLSALSSHLLPHLPAAAASSHSSLSAVSSHLPPAVSSHLPPAAASSHSPPATSSSHFSPAALSSRPPPAATSSHLPPTRLAFLDLLLQQADAYTQPSRSVAATNSELSRCIANANSGSSRGIVNANTALSRGTANANTEPSQGITNANSGSSRGIADANPSRSIADSDPSRTVTDTGPSQSMTNGSSASSRTIANTDPSRTVADSGPSLSITYTDPSLSIADTGPSLSIADTGPSRIADTGQGAGGQPRGLYSILTGGHVASPSSQPSLPSSVAAPATDAAPRGSLKRHAPMQEEKGDKPDVKLQPSATTSHKRRWLDAPSSVEPIWSTPTSSSLPRFPEFVVTWGSSAGGLVPRPLPAGVPGSRSLERALASPDAFSYAYARAQLSHESGGGSGGEVRTSAVPRSGFSHSRRVPPVAANEVRACSPPRPASSRSRRVPPVAADEVRACSPPRPASSRSRRVPPVAADEVRACSPPRSGFSHTVSTSDVAVAADKCDCHPVIRAQPWHVSECHPISGDGPNRAPPARRPEKGSYEVRARSPPRSSDTSQLSSSSSSSSSVRRARAPVPVAGERSLDPLVLDRHLHSDPHPMPGGGGGGSGVNRPPVIAEPDPMPGERAAALDNSSGRLPSSPSPLGKVSSSSTSRDSSKPSGRSLPEAELSVIRPPPEPVATDEHTADAALAARSDIYPDSIPSRAFASAPPRAFTDPARSRPLTLSSPGTRTISPPRKKARTWHPSNEEVDSTTRSNGHDRSFAAPPGALDSRWAPVSSAPTTTSSASRSPTPSQSLSHRSTSPAPPGGGNPTSGHGRALPASASASTSGESAAAAASGAAAGGGGGRSGPAPIECPVCHVTCSSRGNLTVHLRTHTGDKPHRCSVCGQRFSRKQTRDQHLDIHFKRRRFKCPECERSFTQKSQLSRHIRSHSGAKPYSCHRCAKQFADKRNLKVHLAKKHGDPLTPGRFDLKTTAAAGVGEGGGSGERQNSTAVAEASVANDTSSSEYVTAGLDSHTFTIDLQAPARRPSAKNKCVSTLFGRTTSAALFTYEQLIAEELVGRRRTPLTPGSSANASVIFKYMGETTLWQNNSVLSRR